jgi:hypothetical protein
MSWVDDGVKLRLYVSETGDFVSLGTRIEYPFVSGGSGIPADWTFWGSGPQSDVNVTTSGGRFSVSNARNVLDGSTIQYGISRTFPIRSDKRYVVSVQVKTMDGKSVTSRSVRIAPSAQASYTTSIIGATQSDWENVAALHMGTAANTMYVVLTVGNKGEINWGGQFQSFAIVEQELASPVPTWHEVTCDIRNMSLRYGRDKATSRYDVASMGLGIRNDDGEFTYNPHHFWGLRPGRFVKVEATKDGATYPIYYGAIDGFSDRYSFDGHALVNMTCVDVSSLLSNTNVPTVMSDTETARSDIRTQKLLDGVGWSQTQRDLGQGTFIQQPVLANGRSVRDELGLIADSEGGYSFADRIGNIVFRGRDWATNRNTKVVAELLAQPAGIALYPVDNIPNLDANIPNICVNDLQTEWNKSAVVNEVSLANQGGNTIRAVDSESQKKYGPLTYQRMDLLNDNSHPEYLATRMNDLMQGNTEATIRVGKISYLPSGDDWPFTLNVFLDDLVRIRYVNAASGWGYAVVAHVQGIEHSVDPKGWGTSLMVDEYLAFNRWSSGFGPGWDVAVWDVDQWAGNNNAGKWSSNQRWSDPNTVWGK